MVKTFEQLESLFKTLQAQDLTPNETQYCLSATINVKVFWNNNGNQHSSRYTKDYIQFEAVCKYYPKHIPGEGVPEDVSLIALEYFEVVMSL